MAMRRAPLHSHLVKWSLGRHSCTHTRTHASAMLRPMPYGQNQVNVENGRPPLIDHQAAINHQAAIDLLSQLSQNDEFKGILKRIPAEDTMDPFALEFPNEQVSLADELALSLAKPSLASTEALQTVLDAGVYKSFYVVDLQNVKDKYDQWVAHLPRVEPFYAAKCNSDDQIVALLAELGAGFDVASRKEIEQALANGVSADKIIYANPCKQVSSLQFAQAVDVRMMTFDCVEEMEKISRIYPNAQLVLRIQVDDSKSVCQFSAKFGARKSAIPGILDRALELGVDLVGVSFHVGSGCQSEDQFVEAVVDARDVFDQAEARGMGMSLLDIGGGFPSGTAEGFKDEDNKADGSALTFPSIAAKLGVALDTHFPEGSGVRLIAEPGRYFVGSSHTLAVNVIGRKAEKSDDGATTEHVSYYVNDGIYGAFNCIMYDHAEVRPDALRAPHAEPVPLGNLDAASSLVVPSTIWGHSCDGLDKLAENLHLPLVEDGQWMIFDNMGAYTSAAATEFNGLPIADKHYVPVR